MNARSPQSKRASTAQSLVSMTTTQFRTLPSFSTLTQCPQRLVAFTAPFEATRHLVGRLCAILLVALLVSSVQAQNVSAFSAANLPLQNALRQAEGSIQTPFGSSQAENSAESVIVSTLAGSTTANYVDATGTAARFSAPHGVAVDAAGNVYVADFFNHRIRKVTPTGIVTTLAGSGTGGYLDNTGTAAQFNFPIGLALDGDNLYVADNVNNRIRKIEITTGIVTTLAGSGTAGSLDGTGTAAQFNGSTGIVVDGGNLYVADQTGHRIRKIVIATGVVTTLAGSSAGFTNATGTAAQFNTPACIGKDGSGNLYVAERGNHCVRKIVIATGVVTTLAGNGTAGYVNGTGTAAQLYQPYSLTVDGSGNVLVSDNALQGIRKITPAGVVSAFAGSSRGGWLDGAGTVAMFYFIGGLAIDGVGNVYVGDAANNRIRKVTVCTSTVTPSVTIAASPGNSIQSGTNVTFTATPINGGTTPTYLWKKNGNNVGTNSATYATTTLANGDVITCVMTSNAPCTSPATATSDAITMTVTNSCATRPSVTPSKQFVCGFNWIINVRVVGVPSEAIVGWQRGDVLPNQPINFTTIPNTAGLTTYSGVPTRTSRYRAILNNGCDYSAEALVEICPGAGGSIFSGFSKTLGLMVGPNPVSGQLTVKANRLESGLSELTITDLTGRVVQKEQWDMWKGENVKTISTMDLKPSIYLLRLTNQSGEPEVVKFVKQ